MSPLTPSDELNTDPAIAWHQKAEARLRRLDKEQSHANEHKELWLAIDLLYASVLRVVRFNEQRITGLNLEEREKNLWRRKAREIIPCLEKVQDLKDKHLIG